MWFCFFFFFKQKTAYEISVRDWSSDVCSSDLSRTMSPRRGPHGPALGWPRGMGARDRKSVVSGKSVNACVDLGGRRVIKKKKNRIAKWESHLPDAEHPLPTSAQP